MSLEAAVPDMRLELVPIPVSDVDRAKAFYLERCGFALDFDLNPTPGMRIVQLTPPGSACSILLGTGMEGISDTAPGSVRGLHLVTRGIENVRDTLRGRGLDISDVWDMGGVRYASFADPDGNSWLLQEVLQPA